MPTGRYRAVLNGFRCNRETVDDALEWDGKRDEVFVASSVYIKDKNGNTLYKNLTRSSVLGDTNNQPGRVQAGTASDKGGIRTGDIFPARFVTEWLDSLHRFPKEISEPGERDPAASLSRSYPPMLLWEGDLTRGENSVFIWPTIWEWDGSVSFWQGLV